MDNTLGQDKEQLAQWNIRSSTDQEEELLWLKSSTPPPFLSSTSQHCRDYTAGEQWRVGTKKGLSSNVCSLMLEAKANRLLSWQGEIKAGNNELNWLHEIKHPMVLILISVWLYLPWSQEDYCSLTSLWGTALALLFSMIHKYQMSSLSSCTKALSCCFWLYCLVYKR